jgi:hypothetical protein
MIEKSNHRKKGSSTKELPFGKDILLNDYKINNQFDFYRYGHIKLKGNVIIKYRKDIDSNSYILESTKDNNTLKIEVKTQIELWNVIEIIRSKDNKLGYTIELHDLDTKTIYKKLTICKTLSKIEEAENIELDRQRHKRDRARFVLRNTPTRKTRFIRGIDAKTW